MQNKLRHDQYYYLVDQISPKPLLCNKLISSQRYATNKSLTAWADEIKFLLNEIYCQGRKLKYATQLADVYNQAVRLFIALDNFKCARELCYTQIKTFVHWSVKSNFSQIKKYIFQPWINLIRMDRLDGNMYDAFNKLNALANKNQCAIASSYESLSQDCNMYRMIMTKSILERIKLCFATHQYNEMLEFIHNKKICITQSYSIFIQEACAVIYANTGKINEAFSILNHQKINIHPTAERVLRLRECEMRVHLARDASVIKDMECLYQLACQLLNSNLVNINDIIFAIHTGRVLQILARIENTQKLLYFCLEAANRLGDELLIAECLVMLYELVKDQKAKNIIENLMIKHYHHTQYVVARKKMLSCFSDLKYVETNSINQEMIPLFEDLLYFDFACH